MRVLAKTVLNRSEREARHIREYIESQAPDEAVKHLEKVTSERIFGRHYDVWDVWTDKELTNALTGVKDAPLFRRAYVGAVSESGTLGWV